MRNFLSILSICLLLSCEKTDEISKLQRAEISGKSVKLSEYLVILKNSAEYLELNLGLWMFRDENLHVDAIADWIGVQHKGKTILEPINVIWIDFLSQSREEAQQKVLLHLEKNNFLHRSGSSVGYSSYFGNKQWINQYRETWSDKLDAATVNNHGRIFLAHQTITNQNKKVFISTGAFSIEDENHFYISFNKSLEQFKQTESWSLFSEQLHVYTVLQNNYYSTFDHQSVKTFVSQ